MFYWKILGITVHRSTTKSKCRLDFFDKKHILNKRAIPPLDKRYISGEMPTLRSGVSPLFQPDGEEETGVIAMSKNSGGKFLKTLLCAAVFSGAASQLDAADPSADPSRRTIRFVQDDAQDYMVSKIYRLKYVQSNDITPFLMGIVMRYNMNSSVGPIEYGANNNQLITVTCPVKMMPYVDDFISKVDRDIKIDGKTPSDVIKGTGITRAVYQPKFRSGQNLLNVLVNTVIGEGPFSSVYAWDANSNQIYWKDNTSNTSYVYEFLSFLDRPSPQITITATLYEVRESTLRDIGIDYAAWKNGPGLNLFDVGFDAFSISSAGTAAIQAASGPVGGFLFAPQFDASFIRILGQSGKAEVKSTASITAVNSETNSYEIFFDPEFQNIIKSDNDQTSVAVSGIEAGYYQAYLAVNQPVVNLHYGVPQSPYPVSEAFTLNAYTPGAYNTIPGTVCFGYDVQTASVVERNNSGTELIETGKISSSIQLDLGCETVIAQWDKYQEVEETIGVPFLMDIPVLGYIFSTRTAVKEKSRVYLTVKAHVLDTAQPVNVATGILKKISPRKHHSYHHNHHKAD